MKRLLVAIAAVGLLASAFAFFASPASAAVDTVTVQVDSGSVNVSWATDQGCVPNEGRAPGSQTVPDYDPEGLNLDTDCDWTITISSSCVIWGSDSGFGNNDEFGTGDSTTFALDANNGEFNASNLYVTVQDCPDTADHEIYKNVPLADADVFALTTFTFLVTPSENYPASCTTASIDITGDGSPAVVVEAEVAASVVEGNELLNCKYDITEVPIAGWTNQIPLMGMTQFNQHPGDITPFRNVFDPVAINVTKSMDLDDFVILSNIDTGLLNERIDFFISASDGCANSIIDVFNGQLGSTGTFVNTSPAQVELAGFNDNVFTGEDVPVVVDGEACTYVVEELASEDLLEYCAPVNGDTQSLTWAPGLTSLDFTFHNDCEAPAEPEPTPTGTPTTTPDVDDDGGSNGGGPSFAG